MWATTVESGTLSISSDANLGIAGQGTVTLDAGTTLAATGVATLDHAIALNGDPTIAVASGTTTETGTISGTAAELVKEGAGTLVLHPASGSGPNTYSGGTTIDNGTLELATSRRPASAAAITASNLCPRRDSCLLRKRWSCGARSTEPCLDETVAVARPTLQQRGRCASQSIGVPRVGSFSGPGCL